MQQIFKNNRDNYNYNHVFRIGRHLKNPNFISNSMFGMHKIIDDHLNLQNRIRQIIKNTNDNYTLLDKLQSKIKLYDILKIKLEINKVLNKLNTINSIIIEGLKTNIPNLTNISVSIDDVNITDTSFIFTKNILKIYIPLTKIPQYSNYHEVMLYIKTSFKKKIYNILQNFDAYTNPTNFNYTNYMHNTSYQTNNIYLPSIQNFRDCSAPYDRTPLSRQVSESIKGTPVAYALRSVSTHR